MGRMYTVTFDGQTIANADGDYDWFEVSPADDKPVRLWGLYMSQTSDLGDAAEEILTWQVIRGHATSGSGAPVTPSAEPLNPSTAAEGFAVEVLNDVVATTGTPIDLHSGGWNVRIPLEFWWTPETTPYASQGQTTILIRQLDTAADDLTGVSGTLYVEELG
jgi:hypothetical protein